MSISTGSQSHPRRPRSPRVRRRTDPAHRASAATGQRQAAASCRPRRLRSARPTRLRTALATVCISGALEDKLAAAAAAGFDGVEIFEPDFVASSWSAAQVRDTVRRPGAVDRPLPTVPGFRQRAPGDAAGQPAPRGSQVRRDGAIGHRPHPGLLVGGAGRPGRRRPDRRTVAPTGHPGAGPGPAGVVRGAGLGQVREHLRAIVGDRPSAPTTRRSACASTASTSCPAVPIRPASSRSPARSCSSCSWPTRPTWTWTSCSGAGTTDCSRARARSTCRRSSATC